jgi:hypothetical protein
MFAIRLLLTMDDLLVHLHNLVGIQHFGVLSSTPAIVTIIGTTDPVLRYLRQGIVQLVRAIANAECGLNIVILGDGHNGGNKTCGGMFMWFFLIYRLLYYMTRRHPGAPDLTVEASLDAIPYVVKKHPKPTDYNFTTLLEELQTDTDVYQYINTTVLQEYLNDDDATAEYNADVEKYVRYITTHWGYPLRDKFEGVLHLFKDNGDTIYWLCRFTDPFMRSAQRYVEGNYSLIKGDCTTMLREAKSYATGYLNATPQEKEQINWVTANVLTPFLNQGQVANYFYDVCQGLDFNDPVSVYFQGAAWIIVLFVLERWQDIVRLVDEILEY